MSETKSLLNFFISNLSINERKTMIDIKVIKEAYNKKFVHYDIWGKQEQNIAH